MNEIVLELLTKEIVILRTELQKARAEIELRGQSVATLSNYCNEDRETIAKLQEHNKELQSELVKLDSELEFSKLDVKVLLRSCEELQSEKTNLLLHRNSLQAENNKLILERDELKTDLKEQIDAGMWLKHEIEKVIKDRDQMWNNWQLALTIVADLQLKNDEKRQLLKERGVIIDDSIVRENNNG